MGYFSKKFYHLNLFLKAIFSLLLLAICLSGCKKPLVTVSEGDLRFSTDSITFDTIFTTLPTPSRRLMFFNNTGKNLLVKSIQLAGGDNSDFSLVIDGITTNKLLDYTIAKGDSALIFIKSKSQAKDTWVNDKIQFVLDNKTQEVYIRCFVRDAYFYKDSVICSDLPHDKPIVVDGTMIIPNGCTVTLQPGTHLFFTPRLDATFNPVSYLVVDGTLIINGSPAAPVIFEGNRLDEEYKEKRGQWLGVYFTKNSSNSELNFALIKNAFAGIIVDSSSLNAKPKVALNQVEIRNMSAYGIYGRGFADNALTKGPALEARNVLVSNCEEQILNVWGGGRHNYYNCTFANYPYDFSRKDPMMKFNNYYENFIYPQKIDFINCIIHGSKDEELEYDGNTAQPFETNFTNCIVKTSINIGGTGNLLYQDPLFEDPSKRDFHIKDGSPALNSGIVLDFFVDLDGNTRSDFWDMGCYEKN